MGEGRPDAVRLKSEPSNAGAGRPYQTSGV